MSRRAEFTVFVGNIPFDTTEEDIRRVMSNAGPVKSVRIQMDKYVVAGWRGVRRDASFWCRARARWRLGVRG